MTASLFTQSEGDEALCQKISSQNTDTSWHRHSEYHFVLGDTWELPVDFSWLTALTGSFFRLVAGAERIECILVNTSFKMYGCIKREKCSLLATSLFLQNTDLWWWRTDPFIRALWFPIKRNNWIQTFKWNVQYNAEWRKILNFG